MKRFFLRVGVSAAFFLLFPLSGRAAEGAKLVYQATAYVDKDGKAMQRPEGVACNDALVVVVADTGNGRLLRYTFDGEKLQGGEPIPLPQGAYPTRVQIAANGSLYCLDSRQHRILRVGANGEATYLELSGIPQPSAVLVRSFQVDRENNLFLLDPLGWRILVVDATGQYVRTLPASEQMGSLDDLAVDKRGTAYLLDGTLGAVFSANKGTDSFTAIAKGLRELAYLTTDLTVDQKGWIYLTDQSGGSIVVLGPDGSFLGRQSGFGWKEGLLRHPAQICANGKGNVVVADRDNNRVQLFLAR